MMICSSPFMFICINQIQNSLYGAATIYKTIEKGTPIILY